jgi:uracil-DNA glycosylase
MTSNTYRSLELLDEQVDECEDCGLYINGGCKPYWTEDSKYVIIGEAPGRNEIKRNRQFCGSVGDHLWGVMKLQGFHKEDFLIINSVNCKPDKKPTRSEQAVCRKWLNKYLKVFNPSIMMVFGNYAMNTMTNQAYGIMNMNSNVYHNDEFDCEMIMSVHPSMIIYRGQKGQKMLSKSVKKLRSMVYDLL